MPCPDWCVEDKVCADGRLIHLGEAVVVRRGRRAGVGLDSLCLRLVSWDGERARLLLDDIPVHPGALLSEISRAARLREVGHQEPSD